MTMSVIAVLAALVQAGVAPAPAPSATAAADFSITLTGGVPGMIEGSGKGISVRAIADRLAAELQIPVKATRLVGDQTINLEAGKRVPLQTFLTKLAPVVLIDLEVDAVSGETWTALHLLGYNEKAPEKAVVSRGLLVAAGHVAEDGTLTISQGVDEDAARKEFENATDDDPSRPVLAVVVTNGLASVKARKQHVVGMLNDIAHKAKVAFDIRGELNSELVDIRFQDLPLRDIPVAVGREDIRIAIRRELSTGREEVQGVLAGRAPAQRPVLKPAASPKPLPAKPNPTRY